MILQAVVWASSLLVFVTARISNQATRELDWGQAESGAFYSIVAAVDYSAIDGAVVQSSSEGIESIGFLDIGDSLTYQATLPVAGLYEFLARVSTPDGAGSFAVINQDTAETYATITELAATGDWEIWATNTAVLSLPEGTVNLKIEVLEPGFNLLWMSLKQVETESPIVAPTSLGQTLTPTTLVPEQVPTPLPPPPALQSDMCLTSTSAMDYIMMKDCDVNTADGTISLRAKSSILFSVPIATSGKYLLQMTVVRPSKGTLEMVELQTEEQYAIVEHMETDVATDGPKWSMVNNIMAMSSGTHLIHIRSLWGDWTLFALCLQSIDSSNACGK